MAIISLNALILFHWQFANVGICRIVT